MDKKEITVAWVSQHQPLPAQIAMLRAKLGNIKFVPLNDTYKDANEVYRLIREIGAQYAVVVLPLTMIMHLLNIPGAKDITWLRAEMGKTTEQYDPSTDVYTGKGNTQRHARFEKFSIMTEIKVITKPFEVINRDN